MGLIFLVTFSNFHVKESAFVSSKDNIITTWKFDFQEGSQNTPKKDYYTIVYSTMLYSTILYSTMLYHSKFSGEPSWALQSQSAEAVELQPASVRWSCRCPSGSAGDVVLRYIYIILYIYIYVYV